MSDRVRAFIAVEIRDRALLERLVEVQDMIRRTGADVKLVEAENIHVTLRFLGEVLQSQVMQVIDSMKELSFKKIEMELRGLGAFPDLRYMNVIWVGITRGAPELASLSREIEPMVRAAGVPSERRGFSSHITIARVRSRRGKEQLTQIVSEKTDENFGSMPVESIVLKKSVLMPQGPIYSNIYEVEANDA